jgi:hypothetical protein
VWLHIRQHGRVLRSPSIVLALSSRIQGLNGATPSPTAARGVLEGGGIDNVDGGVGHLLILSG